MQRTDHAVQTAIAVAIGAAQTQQHMWTSDFYRLPEWQSHLAYAISGALERGMRLYAILRDPDTTAEQLRQIYRACPNLFDRYAPLPDDD